MFWITVERLYCGVNGTRLFLFDSFLIKPSSKNDESFRWIVECVKYEQAMMIYHTNYKQVMVNYHTNYKQGMVNCHSNYTQIMLNYRAILNRR